MAILVTKATNSTNTYTLGSTDTDNTIYGSNVAETFTFNGTGNLSIADVAGADVLTLTNVSPVAGVTIAVTGNNVILTSSGKTYTLAALSNGESITVNLGSDKQSIVITATDTTDANNVTTTNYAYTLNGSATPVEFTAASAIVFDTIAPTASFIAATDNVGSVQGNLMGLTPIASTTDDSSLVLSGTNETGSTVNVYDGTTLLGAATVTGTTWSFTATVANTRTYSFNVKETDYAGNTSGATSNFVVTGDTVAPITTAPVVLAITSAALTNDVTPVVSGTAETGTTITAVIAGATYTTTATNGTWSVDTETATPETGTLAIAANGTNSNSISVTATDTAGNTSNPVAQTLTVDTTAPTLAITSSVSAVKIGETATITFTFDETPVGFAAGDIITTGCTLTGLAVNPTDNKIYTATFTPTANTASATASITVASGTYTDAATNAGGAGTTPTISIDTLEPSAPTLAEVTSKTVDGYLNATEATSTTFKVTLPTTGSVAVAGDKVDVLSNGVSIKNVTLVDADITAGFVDVPILSTELGSDDSKSLTAKITDVAGNVGAASSALAFILDATAPTAPTTVTLSLVGGNVIANLLNNTNTSLEALATITAGEVTGGSAVLKINGTTVATDASIAPNDTTVSFSVSDAATITTGGTATVEITDLAGNTTVSSVANPTLTVNRTASTLTASAPAISVDNGSSTTDLKTNRAVQTITSTLGRALTTNEVLYGLTNNDVIWTDITSKVSTTALSWDGAVLAVGSNNISLKVKDSVTGNETIVNTAGYILDTIAPAHAPTFALSTDSGISNSDGISTTGTITVTAPTNGFETNARWDYSLDSGQIWSSVQATGVASFTLPIGSYAIGAVQVRHIDEAGNASVSSTNAAAIVIDQTSPTASVTTAVVKNGGADKVVVQSTEKGIAYLVKSTLTQPTTYAEITTLETNNDTSVNHVAITTAATNTDLLTTSLVDGTYKVYTVDEAGNLSAVSTNSIVVDSTAPVVTITGASFVQKNLTTENTIRLTGSGFASLLTTGKEVTGSDINDSRFDWTKFSWVVTGATAQAITSSDIAEIKVTSATELDIVLKSTNALYSNANFLTGGDAAADTLAITVGFLKDAAGNAAVVTNGGSGTSMNAATVDPYTLFKMELLNGTNAPTIYVPNIELTAPTTKANGVDYDNATFDGTNLKATPTVGLSILGIHTGQTVTVNNLGKMDYIDVSNTISFSSAASETGSISFNLSGVRSIILNNDATNPANTSVTFMGGGAYTDLGSSTVDEIQLTTLAPVPAVGNAPIDWVINFETGIDKVNFKASEFMTLTSATNSLQIDVSLVTVGGDGAAPANAVGTNIWLLDDGTIAYDADGTWGTYDAGAMTFNGSGSIALINIAGVVATDLYLV